MKEESYTEVAIRYLDGRRDMKKIVFKIMYSFYRAVQNGRMTWEQVEEQIKKLGGKR